MLRISSAPLRPCRVTADRAGRYLFRRAARRALGLPKAKHRKGFAMFFLRIEHQPDGDLDVVQLTDDRFGLLLEIEGRGAAINWLCRHGCSPQAARRLRDCAYRTTYRIGAPVTAPGAQLEPPKPIHRSPVAPAP